jgi:hypothetical protein
MHIAMAKSALHPLLQTLRDVEFGREAQNGNRCFSRLGNVQQVVKQRLSSMGSKKIKLLQDKYDRFGNLIARRSRYFLGVGEDRQEHDQGVGIAFAALFVNLHFTAQLAPYLSQR